MKIQIKKIEIYWCGMVSLHRLTNNTLADANCLLITDLLFIKQNCMV